MLPGISSPVKGPSRSLALHSMPPPRPPSARCYNSPVKTYTVVLSPELEGGFSVSCPAMPGALSQGATRDEALANIAE